VIRNPNKLVLNSRIWERVEKTADLDSKRRRDEMKRFNDTKIFDCIRGCCRWKVVSEGNI